MFNLELFNLIFIIIICLFGHLISKSESVNSKTHKVFFIVSLITCLFNIFASFLNTNIICIVIEHLLIACLCISAYFDICRSFHLETNRKKSIIYLSINYGVYIIVIALNVIFKLWCMSGNSVYPTKISACALIAILPLIFVTLVLLFNYRRYIGTVLPIVCLCLPIIALILDVLISSVNLFTASFTFILLITNNNISENLISNDRLTCALNRYAFDKKMFSLKRKCDKVGILFIDVDNLKIINDTHGHRAGDELLINTSKIIKQSISDVDTLYRIGGDEFVVIANLDNINDIYIIMEKIEKELELYNKKNKTNYSISIGGSATTNKCKINDCLAEADQRMYEQKKIHHSRSSND